MVRVRVSTGSPGQCWRSLTTAAAPRGADGLLQLFRAALECSICFLMDLPGLRPVPPVRVLVVGWGACMAHVTDLTNLQLAISAAVAAAGGARWSCTDALLCVSQCLSSSAWACIGQFRDHQYRSQQACRKMLPRLVVVQRAAHSNHAVHGTALVLMPAVSRFLASTCLRCSRAGSYGVHDVCRTYHVVIVEARCSALSAHA